MKIRWQVVGKWGALGLLVFLWQFLVGLVLEPPSVCPLPNAGYVSNSIGHAECMALSYAPQEWLLRGEGGNELGAVLSPMTFAVSGVPDLGDGVASNFEGQLVLPQNGDDWFSLYFPYRDSVLTNLPEFGEDK